MVSAQVEVDIFVTLLTMIDQLAKMCFSWKASRITILSDPTLLNGGTSQKAFL